VRSTRFTERFGCNVPIQLAPMGAMSSIELMAAVTAAGGMAMTTLTMMGRAEAEEFLAEVERRVAGPWGIGFLVPVLDPAVLEIAATRAPYIDFYHGPPEAGLLDSARSGGARVGWQVTSRDAARAAAELGVDLVVVRGVEGGGRLEGEGRPLLPLLAEVLDDVGADVPVLAAGGIATGRGLAAVLAAGADGARLGTRFVATQESGAHPDYRQAIVDASADDSVLTTRFSVLWPPGPTQARVLRQAVDAAEALAGEVAGEMTVGGTRLPVPRWGAPPPTTDTTGEIGAMALYAGESAGLIDAVVGAGEVVAAIVAEATALLERVAPTPGA
jgi:nitronate monooxygenase